MNDIDEIRRIIDSDSTDYNDLCTDLVIDIVPALCDEIEELRGVVQLAERQPLELDVEGSSPSSPLLHVPPRIMCMCEGGHNRSGALALQLKQRGVDAIQIGWRHNPASTINYVAAWADFIILMQPWDTTTTKISSRYESKIRVLDVGPDRWGSNTNMELNLLVAPYVEDWIRRDFSI
jgi:hypothetical protein